MADFLNKTVATSLSEGLAHVARLQPEDAVDFLGKWLVRHADYLEQQEKVRGGGVTGARTQ